MKKDKDKPNYVQRDTKKEDSNIMMKKTITAIAILLSIAQIGFVVYFLMMYTSDNVPLFMFLLVVPLVNLLAIFLSKH